MNKEFRTGLVVGKFAPLHHGHVSVINAALARCETVIVISYSNPELPGCAPDRRSAWLAACFPQTIRLVVTDAALADWLPGAGLTVPPNDAPADVHRDFCARLCLEVAQRRPDAVFTSEEYGPGFAEHLTRHGREQDAGAPAVTHVAVDPDRVRVPVSGTRLRSDLWQNWHFLPQPVRASLVQRVVFLGGESTGKSTLAAALAQRLGTLSVAEYGRELWEAQGGVLTAADLDRIGVEQPAREEAARPKARAFLFCDTSPLTTLFYSLEMFGGASPALRRAADRPYDHVFLCAGDFPFVQDGTRQDETFRLRQNAWYQTELERRGVPYHHLRGPLAARMAAVLAVLGRPAC